MLVFRDFHKIFMIFSKISSNFNPWEEFLSILAASRSLVAIGAADFFASLGSINTLSMSRDVLKNKPVRGYIHMYTNIFIYIYIFF